MRYLRYIISIAPSFFLSVVVINGCDSATRYFEDRYPDNLYATIPYQLDSPDVTLRLPRKLNEISGLSMYEDGSLMAVEDEDGILYVLSPEDASIKRKIKFGKKGDYEGLEYVYGKVYITKSNGNIYYFDYPPGKDNIKVEATKIRTPLTPSNDVEGLGFNYETNQLLIACKGKGEVNGNNAKGKSIYAIHLPGQVFGEMPVYSFKTKELREFVELRQVPVRKKVSFKLSGIAVHPTSQRIYLLAHAGKAIVVLNPDGSFYGYYPLNPVLFRQPEGITFSAGGVLFISNEGGGRAPVIQKFSPR